MWEGLNYIEASEIKMIMILLNVVYCVADALRALGERERESLPQRKEEGGPSFVKVPHFLERYRTILSTQYKDYTQYYTRLCAGWPAVYRASFS